MMRKERGPQHMTIEAKITGMLAAGMSKREICEEFNITLESLNTRLARIRKKQAQKS